MFNSGNLFMLDYWRHALGKWFISPFIIFKGSKWIKPRPHHTSSDCFTLKETSNFCCQFLWITIRSDNQAWNYSETSVQFLVLKHNSRAQHKTPLSTNIKVDIKGKLWNTYHSFVTNLILLEVARDILFLTSPYLWKSVSLSNGLLKPDRVSTFSIYKSISALY